MVRVDYGAAAGDAASLRLERSRRPASTAAALIVTLGLSALGLVVAVCLVSAHTASPVAMVNFPEVAADGSPQHPPLYDHTFWGVGNEDRIERRANWALKVIGKMNGTALEAMIANGTIGSEAEVVDPALVSEIHQAMDEQNREFDINAPASDPFPFEAAQAAAAEGEDEGADDDEDEGAEEGDEDEAAEGDEDEAAEGDEDEAAEGDEEPAAEGDEEPAAEGDEEPAAEGDEEPAAEGEEEPAAEEGAPEEEPAAAEEEPAA
eukprot:Tamp_19355.p2 GENE.Tamp_19355~~Tamp_19355.p2  ORF type:complete len:263 (-),score=96.16 Tamp_19355:474-1262(-)